MAAHWDAYKGGWNRGIRRLLPDSVAESFKNLIAFHRPGQHDAGQGQRGSWRSRPSACRARGKAPDDGLPGRRSGCAACACEVRRRNGRERSIGRQPLRPLPRSSPGVPQGNALDVQVQIGLDCDRSRRPARRPLRGAPAGRDAECERGRPNTAGGAGRRIRSGLCRVGDKELHWVSVEMMSIELDVFLVDGLPAMSAKGFENAAAFFGFVHRGEKGGDLGWEARSWSAGPTREDMMDYMQLAGDEYPQIAFDEEDSASKASTGRKPTSASPRMIARATWM